MLRDYILTEASKDRATLAWKMWDPTIHPFWKGAFRYLPTVFYVTCQACDFAYQVSGPPAFFEYVEKLGVACTRG